MTLNEQLLTVLLCAAATVLTRFLPFLVFSSKKPTPPYVAYLGRALPAAVFGMLLVYCLKNVSVFTGSHGLPELIALCAVTGLHLWKRKMMLSIAGGIAVYMLLLAFVF